MNGFKSGPKGGPKSGRTLRIIAATAALTTAGGSVGCGYLLYPERRGAQSGTIDSGTMVMDLLWLLPGILPGVVALIVDFSSGAIYVRGRSALRLSPGGHIAVQLPHSSKPTTLEFRLVTSSDRILVRKTAFVGPSTLPGQSIEFEIGTSMRGLAQPGDAGNSQDIYLEVQNESGTSTRFPTSISVVAGA